LISLANPSIARVELKGEKIIVKVKVGTKVKNLLTQESGLNTFTSHLWDILL